MKNMKKLFSLALALVMMMALVVTAGATGASGTNASPNNSGKITIDNAIPGQTYTIYKMFDLESYSNVTETTTGTTGNFSYKVVDAWKDFFKAADAETSTAAGAGNKYITLNKDGYIETIAKDMDAAAFAKEALEFAKKNNIQAAKDAQVAPAAGDKQTTSTVTFGELNLGYYLVDSTTGALCSLNTTATEVVIKEKNKAPTIDKTENEKNNDGSVSIGDTVEFQIKITAEPGAQNYAVYDTLGDGLTLKTETIKVYKGEVKDENLVSENENTTFGIKKPTAPATTISYKDKNNTDATASFGVVFAKAYLDAITEETTLYITYEATVNDNAVSMSIGNDVTMKYGDNSWISDSTHGGHDGGNKLGSITIDKYDSTNENTKLADAEFELYKMVNGKKEQVKVKEVMKSGSTTEVDYYIPDPTATTFASIKTNSKGAAVIKGLGEGEYYLRETAAPKGYNKLTDDVTVKTTVDNVEVNGLKYNDTTHSVNSATSQISNSTGTELPETGGIGTTIFTVTGAVLMIGAAILFLTKKRSEA